MSKTPVLDKAIDLLAKNSDSPIVSRRDALIHIRNIHDTNKGLFYYAAARGLLDADGSCTELNIQFYTAYNEEIEHRY